MTIVSPLNTNQYRDGAFFAYPYEQSAPVTPVTGRRIMNVAGTEDGLIPYNGGRGVAGYTFVSSEDSIFAWARHMGYTGNQLMEGIPDGENMNLVGFSYLFGDVVHYKLIGGRHNAGGDPDVRRLIDNFFCLRAKRWVNDSHLNRHLDDVPSFASYGTVSVGHLWNRKIFPFGRCGKLSSAASMPFNVHYSCMIFHFDWLIDFWH